MPSYTFSQRRLSWVFEGTWKVSTKRCDQLHIFFAVQTILIFWWDLESFDKKLWPVAPFWQYSLSQVFDGTWKNFHKVCPVTRCVRCGDYLKFWMGLRKVSTKMCAQLHVFAVQTISSFWLDLEKFRQKGATSHTFFFAVQTILSFEWGFEKFPQKCVPSYTFSQRRLSWVFEGTWKVSTKRCDQLHIFFAVQTILSFWGDLESVDKKLWPVAPFWQYSLSQVFDGTWKNFHKEVCPVTRCVRCGDYLKFWMGLRKVSTKMCAQLHVFAVQTISSFWLDLEKFRQKGATSHTFFSQCRLS